ncbi:hypothetical protein C8R43DRAFT_1231658 [Mycena crocata]|nr:hypothetical protein C8R43DRAFT_1231658 [Mycena crocata]
MHRATALVFALFFTSLVAAAPLTPVAVVSDSSVDVVVPTSAANMAVPIADILPTVAVHDQSETYPHVPEFVHSAEKSRRRSFRRRHP